MISFFEKLVGHPTNPSKLHNFGHLCYSSLHPYVPNKLDPNRQHTCFSALLSLKVPKNVYNMQLQIFISGQVTFVETIFPFFFSYISGLSQILALHSIIFSKHHRHCPSPHPMAIMSLLLNQLISIRQNLMSIAIINDEHFAKLMLTMHFSIALTQRCLYVSPTGLYRWTITYSCLPIKEIALWSQTSTSCMASRVETISLATGLLMLKPTFLFPFLSICV